VIPISRLSDADQAFVRQLQSAKSTPDAIPFEGLEWPRRVGLPDDYDVTVVREDRDASEYVYRTPNFEFRSNVKLARKVVREFGAIFEATYAAMQAFPLHWKIQPEDERFVTQLFATRDQYYAAGGIINSGGAYSSRSGSILVPLASLGVEKSSSGVTLDDTGEHATLIHEITHQVHHQWLPKLPVWMTEGIAVYMESVPYGREEFRFDPRHSGPFARRWTSNHDEYPMVPIEHLMTKSHADWNDIFSSQPHELSRYYFSAFLLINYFLHFDEEGDGRRIWAYIRAIESGTPEVEARAHLLDGRSFDELFEDIRRAYDREDLELTPFPVVQ